GGWCTDGRTDGTNQIDQVDQVDQVAGARGRRSRQEDPAAWTLHVLREHLRSRLADTHCAVLFNDAGGVIVHLFHALPEDVALFREALGLQLTGAKSTPEHECVVHFGNDPYQREVTMAWFTTPRLLY